MYTAGANATAETGDARYRQIESSLRTEIVKGRWPAGVMMPSRRELAKEYGVSLITLERAIAGLLKDGLLLAHDRRGTFVADPLPALLEAPPAPDTAEPVIPAAETPLLPQILLPRKRGGGSTGTVGIVASLFSADQSHLELNNFWVRLLVHSLEQDLSRNEHSTQFFNRFQGIGRPLIPLKDAVDMVLASGADAAAIIALGMDPDEVDNSISSVEQHKMAVVCITSGDLRRPVPCVTYDNRGAGYRAAEHLLRDGGRDIFFLAPFMAPWVKERLEGIEAAVAHAGLPPDAVRVYPHKTGPWGVEEDPMFLGYEAGRRAFDAGLNPSRIVCANDGVAFGFLRAASERGLKFGEDFGIVSFDDHPEARNIGLTSLRPPMEAMGQAAARLLRSALNDDLTNTSVRLRWDLLPRDSTRMQRPTIGFTQSAAEPINILSSAP